MLLSYDGLELKNIQKADQSCHSLFYEKAIWIKPLSFINGEYVRSSASWRCRYEECVTHICTMDHKKQIGLMNVFDSDVIMQCIFKLLWNAPTHAWLVKTNDRYKDHVMPKLIKTWTCHGSLYNACMQLPVYSVFVIMTIWSTAAISQPLTQKYPGVYCRFQERNSSGKTAK